MYLHYIIDCVYNYIVSVIQYFRCQYTIKKVMLMYERDGEKDSSDVTVEYKYYGGAQTVMNEMSHSIEDFVFYIMYTYKSKSYVYMTRKPDHAFPPARSISFRVPVKDARVYSKEGEYIRNYTDRIKMHEGPNADFHGEDILLKDLGLNKGETLRLTNVLGFCAECEEKINHRTIWLPGKT